MKLPYTFLLITLLCVLSARAVSQVDSTFHRVELGGSVWIEDWREEALPSLPQYLYTGVRNRVYLVNPVIGYFITPEIQLLSELAYEYRWRTDVVNTSGAPDPFSFHFHHHRVAFGLGVSYNFQLSGRIVPFAGTRVAVSWAKYGTAVDSENFSYSTWSPPQVFAPSFFLGARVFVSRDWAVFAKATFERRTNSSWNPDLRSRSYSFGMGMSTFL